MACPERTIWSEEYGLIGIDDHNWVEVELTPEKQGLKCITCGEVSVGFIKKPLQP